MKKYFLVICALLLFFVTGCGNKNQVKCTGSMSDGGIEAEAEIIADFDNDDKLTGVTVIEDLGDKEKADQMCALFKAFVSSDMGIDISCSGSKVIINGYEKMADDEEDKMTGMTKEEFKKAMEEETEGNVTCK